MSPPPLCFLPAALGTSDNGSNQFSSTGSQLSAAERDCIRAIKAKVSWTLDGTDKHPGGGVLSHIQVVHCGFICFVANEICFDN